MSKRKRTVMFLGCNTAQLPYLRALKRRGFRVVATDRNPKARPEEADAFYGCGYTDLHGLLVIADKEKPAHVFTAASHHAWEGAAAIAEYCGIDFPSRAAVDCCLDKSKLYRLFDVLDVPYPITYQTSTQMPLPLADGSIYWLKSDYGKSPRYCQRFTVETMPAFPDKDEFYRRVLLIQEEFDGAHLRINLCGDQVNAFLVFEEYSVALHTQYLREESELTSRLKAIARFLDMSRYLVKFDVLVSPEAWVVLDVGLDPPMRLKAVADQQGVDFADAYVGTTLLGESMFCWQNLFREWTTIAH